MVGHALKHPKELRNIIVQNMIEEAEQQDNPAIRTSRILRKIPESEAITSHDKLRLIA